MWWKKEEKQTNQAEKNKGLIIALIGTILASILNAVGAIAVAIVNNQKNDYRISILEEDVKKLREDKTQDHEKIIILEKEIEWLMREIDELKNENNK